MVHYRGLDGLRGVAVLLVMLFHFGYFTAGWVGVQIFFVLSGFLITSILVAERAYPADYFKRFYWRRSLRIFPLYFAYLAVLSVVFAVSGAPDEFQHRWPYLYSYTYNYALLMVPLRQSPAFTHFWSLAVEEQFYLLWPFAVYYLSGRSLRVAVATALVASPVFRLVAVWLVPVAAPGHPEPGLFAYSPLLAQCDALATGAALALLPRTTTTRRFPLGAVTVGAIGLGVAAGLATLPAIPAMGNWQRLLAAAGGATGFGYPPFATHLLQHVWSYTVVNLWSALLVCGVLRGGTLNAVLGNRALVYTGSVSYGLYVFHYPVLGLMKAAAFFHPYSWEGLAMFVVYLGTVFAVAGTSFAYFEKRFLAWKDLRFARQAPAASFQA